MRKKIRAQRRDPSPIDLKLKEAYQRFRAEGFPASEAHELAVFWTRQVIGGIGDRNFLEYSGGVVYRTKQGDLLLEWVEAPPEHEDLHSPKARWEVYRVDLSDADKHLDWVDWKEVASFTGQSVNELLRDLRSSDPMKVATAVWQVADYYGWHELDHYPLILNKKEVEHRYGVIL
jgi:hypothetical protein